MSRSAGDPLIARPVYVPIRAARGTAGPRKADIDIPRCSLVQAGRPGVGFPFPRSPRSGPRHVISVFWQSICHLRSGCSTTSAGTPGTAMNGAIAPAVWRRQSQAKPAATIPYRKASADGDWVWGCGGRIGGRSLPSGYSMTMRCTRSTSTRRSVRRWNRTGRHRCPRPWRRRESDGSQCGGAGWWRKWAVSYAACRCAVKN